MISADTLMDRVHFNMSIRHLLCFLSHSPSRLFPSSIAVASAEQRYNLVTPHLSCIWNCFFLGGVLATALGSQVVQCILIPDSVLGQYGMGAGRNMLFFLCLRQTVLKLFYTFPESVPSKIKRQLLTLVTSPTIHPWIGFPLPVLHFLSHSTLILVFWEPLLWINYLCTSPHLKLCFFISYKLRQYEREKSS